MHILYLSLLLLKCMLTIATDREEPFNLRSQTTPFSVSSKIEKAIDLQSDSLNVENAIWDNNFKSEFDRLMANSGVTIKRTIDSLDETLSLYLSFEGGASCKEEDEYGNNDCHYNWGSDLSVSVMLNTNKNPFEEHDTVVGKFKVDYIVPWKFTCAVCGEDCTLSFPVIKQGVTFPAPPCPFAEEESIVPFVVPLGPVSPVLGIPAQISGHLTVKRAGTVVARVSIESTVV